jgi:uncharacterized protein (TIGR00369 family)
VNFSPNDSDTVHGLQVLRQTLSRTRYVAPICQTLSFWAIAFDPGRAVFEAEPGSSHMNAMGVIHGGYAATVLDSALGTAVHTTLDKNERYATTDLVVKLVAAIKPSSGLLRCEASVVHRGRRMATAEARLWDSAGTLCAHGSATCFISGASSNPR